VINDDNLFTLQTQEARDKVMKDHPWTKDPQYFKKAKISLLALMKMLVHARMGGSNEVMGLMQGKVDKDTFIIMNIYALPVEATETRVNASTDANQFIV
jgi:COP9 signalosome complex subunit 5